MAQVQKPWLKQAQAPQGGAGWSNTAQAGTSWGSPGKGSPGKGSGWGNGKGTAWGNGNGQAAPWGKGNGSVTGGATAAAGGGAKGGGRTPVPEGTQIDSNARHLGKVSMFKKWSGFGFIEPAQPGVVPGADNMLFVHWKNITTEDRFPHLSQDLEVEFSLVLSADRTLRANNVTLPGAAPISLQDEEDAEKKAFVGGQHLRYTGTLKFYYSDQGFGYITIDDGYQVPEDMPTELRVERAEVNAAGKQPMQMKNIQVEFGIWKTDKNQYKAYNMTLPGGIPATVEALENRQSCGPRMYAGVVEIWNWQNGWGLIKVPPGVVFPPNVTHKLQEMKMAAQAKGKTPTEEVMVYFRKEDVRDGVQVDKAKQVTFQVYLDDKGAGACEVH